MNFLVVVLVFALGLFYFIFVCLVGWLGFCLFVCFVGLIKPINRQRHRLA